MKTYTSIFDKVRQEREFFENGSVVLIQGKENILKFNQRDTINRIEFYTNSVYEGSPYDSEGFPKPFYDIVNFPIEVSAKSIDIDTKDFRFFAEGNEYWPAFLFTKEFKVWVKDTWFAKFLNEVRDELPKYGSVVAKKVKSQLELVNLHMFRNEPSVRWLKDSAWIHEVHRYNPNDLKKFPNWDKAAVKEIIARYKTGEKDYIEITEAYGFVPKSWIATHNKDYALNVMSVEDGEEEVPAVFMLYGIDDKDDKGVDVGVAVYAEEVKEWPYRDLHWRRVRGRWLGKGEVEILFEDQVAHNKVVYFDMKGLEWSSKQIFQTSDSQYARNLLTDVRNGDILRRSKDSTGIERIDTSERNIPAYNHLLQVWGKIAQEKTFSFEVETGKSLPSGTPFRLGALLRQAVDGHWAQKREDFGLFLKEIIFEFILPVFKSHMNSEHIMKLFDSDEDIDLFDEILAKSQTRKAIFDRLEAGGELPAEDELLAEVQRLIQSNKKVDERAVKIVEGYFKDIRFKVDLEITGESVDFSATIESFTNILTTIANNPAIMQDPVLRRVLFKVINMAGISPITLKTNAAAQRLPAPLPSQPTSIRESAAV